MIVQATDIGGEDGAAAGEAEFGLKIPGMGTGGSSAACDAQWSLAGRPEADIGLAYGGMLARCQGCAEPGLNCVADHTRPYEEVRACVRDMCSTVFGSPLVPHLRELQASCDWFVDWLEAADNPTFTYREIYCPSEILGALSMSGTEREGVTGWHSRVPP